RGRGAFEALAEPKMLDLLDLVALGTVADVARLKSLNRAFVTQGLRIMAARQNIGLAALAEAARLVKRSRIRARPTDQRRRSRRQIRSRSPPPHLQRPRGSADHRRGARPAER